MNNDYRHDYIVYPPDGREDGEILAKAGVVIGAVIAIGYALDYVVFYVHVAYVAVTNSVNDVLTSLSGFWPF